MSLPQEIGKADFIAALELAAEQQMYGAEELRAIVTLPSACAPKGSAQAASDALVLSGPPQPEVERDLAEVMSAMLPIGRACCKRSNSCKEHEHE